MLTSTILSFGKICDIGHDGLGLDKAKVKPELSATLIVYLDDEGFASPMVNF